MQANRTQELQDRVRAAVNDKQMLKIVGGNSKHFYGNPDAVNSNRSEIIETRIHQGVITYEPTELVITVRAGTPLKDIEQLLKDNKQMLPFEPPHYGEHATIGGVVASGLSGPRRPFTGSVRDFVLGIKMINGKGEVLSFGGQVMKNVAGYDVSRLMVGALGTLGLLLEISIKVLPLPQAEITQRMSMSQQEALDTMHRLFQTPLPLSALSYVDRQLYIRLSGAHSAVTSAKNRIGGDTMVHAENFWQQLNEQTHPFFTNQEHVQKPLWRLSVPFSAEIDAEEKSFIDWAGALYWLHSDRDAKEIQQLASNAGGSASLYKAENNDERFMPLHSKMKQLHLNLKMKFDPYGIFNFGRLYSDL